LACGGLEAKEPVEVATITLQLVVVGRCERRGRKLRNRRGVKGDNQQFCSDLESTGKKPALEASHKE
jgi:hypothetical protein